MSDDDQQGEHEPGMSEAAFYLGSGAFLGFVAVLIVGISIIGFHVTSDGRAAAESAAADAGEADELTVGADIYATRCSSCHGSNGEGGIGPPFVGIAERITDPNEHAALVRDGRGQMPAFAGTLSDGQIELVVRYEREVLGIG